MCGYEVIRADQIPKPGIITSQVVQHLIEDPMVIADLAGWNPNVFYELALRHVVKKPIVQLIQLGEVIPFDVAGNRTIQVDYKDLDSVDECKRELEKQIDAVEEDPSLVDSPISFGIDVLLSKSSDNPAERNYAEIAAALSDLRSEVRLLAHRQQNVYLPLGGGWIANSGPGAPSFVNLASGVAWPLSRMISEAPELLKRGAQGAQESEAEEKSTESSKWPKQ
jgi:hypothetical protein